MNIVFIGYRCCGKTAVGRLLAGKLGRDFVDMDVLIEKDTGCSIEMIISKNGWDQFRRIEKSLIEKISEREDLVIATGGGAVMDDRNVKNLGENGLIIWLKGDAEVLKDRMAREIGTGKIRPSLTGADPLEEITRVLGKRTPFYKKAATFVIDTTLLTLQEVMASVMNVLPKEMKV